MMGCRDFPALETNPVAINKYGVEECNPVDPAEQALYLGRNCRKVDWTTLGLYITRFRLVGDVGFPFWDVSYCWGIIRPTGERVFVSLPFDQLPKRGWRREVVKYAKQDRVYAHGIGIFENVSTLC